MSNDKVVMPKASSAQVSVHSILAVSAQINPVRHCFGKDTETLGSVAMNQQCRQQQYRPGWPDHWQQYEYLLAQPTYPNRA